LLAGVILLGFMWRYSLVVAGVQEHPIQNYLLLGSFSLHVHAMQSNVNVIKKYLQSLVSPLYVWETLCSSRRLLLSFFYLLWWCELECIRVGFQSFGYIVFFVFFWNGHKILFNKLVQNDFAGFASSVTYLMPVMGLTWGVLDD
jgi:hypothetical protein